ncbi:hypothetical protein VPH35_032013 [Triticum aestivum]
MALSSGILALSIDKQGGHRDAWLDNRAAVDSTLRAMDEAENVEMGSMSFFIEGVQNERPVCFSSQQLRGFTQGFAHKVGSGCSGRFPNGTLVAVKVLNSTLGRRAEEQFMAEVGTIGRTYHINLVRLYGFCFDTTVKALVYEYMENGSLDRHLFGLAPEKSLREDTQLTITGARGTTGYAATELWMPLPVTHKCDVYNYDMLLSEMLGRGGQAATKKAARMCKVALWCVQYRPEDRPSMGNVVRMLEGEEQIPTQGNSFAHLAAYIAGTTPSDDTTMESHGSSAFIDK